MKRLGIFGLLLLTGCATSTPVTPPVAPPITSLVYTWTGDGNANTPVCNLGALISDTNNNTFLAAINPHAAHALLLASVLVNCKITFQITDTTTGTFDILPITQRSYTAPVPTHVYEIRVNGYDATGAPISSSYVMSPVK